MELMVVRKYFLPTYTIGKLLVNGSVFCDTLEDTVRELKDLNDDGDFMDSGEGKVYGETAIPYGRYKVGLVYWDRRKRRVPILYNVPGFTGILIHSGKNALHTLGCILVGENKVKGGLINSSFWENRLILLVEEVMKRKEEVFITITKI